MQRIILAFDKFKGSLTSNEVAEAFAQGWRRIVPDSDIVVVPIADGGDGMLQSLVSVLGATMQSVVARDPLGRMTACSYAMHETTAIIEMAQISGLALLRVGERNPMLASTYGLGEVMRDALDRGARRMILGIGGSATNDCGMGMLSALGYRFYNMEGEELTPSGEAMCRVAKIDASHADARLAECEIVVASDVDNLLYGERGAAWVYAKQKGAAPAMVEALDAGMRRFSAVVGGEYHNVEGAGAAGGVGYALIALLGAELKPGIELVLDTLGFDMLLDDAQLVITGEGRIDVQTLMGKAPAGVLAHSKRKNIPVIALGGGVEWCDELLAGGFTRIYEATPEGMPLKEAMQQTTAQQNICRAASRIAREWLLLHS
ncbi:MAG: glycerate kinase [Alistipes sp.]|nr:glycerate kinase [Alistipes sp.]